MKNWKTLFAPKQPKLSIVVIVYKMPSQAMNTLHTLSSKYQLGVSASDYEVVVIENTSDDMLGEAAALKYGFNFSYFERPNNSVSPAGAINFGVEQAKSDFICLMIDGARMVTPGVVKYSIDAQALADRIVVAVPGYHIGHELQQVAVQKGYNPAIEKELLDSARWREDGYGLFDIACFSGTSINGYFSPMAESNCLCFTKKMFKKIGGCDTRFDLPGGGFLNLDLYKRLCELRKTKLIVLLGEGSFHQLHGGVSTSESYERLQDTVVPQFRKQYIQIRGRDYFAPQNKPVYLGSVSKQALKFAKLSAEKALEKNGRNG